MLLDANILYAIKLLLTMFILKYDHYNFRILTRHILYEFLLFKDSLLTRRRLFVYSSLWNVKMIKYTIIY